MKLKHLLVFTSLFLLPFESMAALTIAPSPLFATSPVEPRVMLLMSRDHELSKKAYNDYSDLNGDGVLDTTYNDSIAYYGYFDSKKCYDYLSSRFAPAAAATGTNLHHCIGQWSGNFLNWASMTRMDVLRKTFYGGYRSTDSTTETVLERHFLPDDVHAFVKVYNPGSATTLSQYVPSTVVGTNTALSLCNVSDSTDTDKTGLSSFTMPPPLIKVAAGAWPQWDASEITQCAIAAAAGGTQPTTLLGSAYIARVKVCDATGGVETNCKTYTDPSTSAQTIKPTGLLQTYGDVDAQRRTRFGLMTGSYAANKSGGVLRKNVGLITNNNGAALNSSSSCSTSSSSTTVNGNANDEINVCTGQFINQAATQAGIINTLNRLHIAGFKYTSSGGNDTHQYSCNGTFSTLFPSGSFTNGQCVDWGNPLSETYLEALRYFANAGATAAFNQSDASILNSIPLVTWADPLPSTQWCAQSSIIVLSTGLNSFDTDELASFTPSGGSPINAATLTETVGDSSHENINGNIYLIGDIDALGNGTVGENQCTAKTVTNLADAKGICPQVPSLQGGYGIAGLAYAPKTLDLRPSYAAQRTTRWSGTVPDWALRQPINTYAVQLAETLPSFSPTSHAVTVLPACMAQASSVGAAVAWPSPSASNWRNCSVTNVIVDANVATASVGSDTSAKTNTCSGNGTTSQCFTVAWENWPWGNDYDMDGIQRLGYCVGSACETFKMLCPTILSAYASFPAVLPAAGSVPANQVKVYTCAAQAQASVSHMTFGYTITGTTNDGVSFPILRPAGANFNVGHVLAATITSPNAASFTESATPGANLLENPLWYTAKYGGFTESTPTTGTPNPNLQSEWDKVDNTTGLPKTTGSCVPGDCIPDTYYDVRNPAQLAGRLALVLDQATLPESSASAIATNSTRLDTQTVVYQAKFTSKDWSGQLLAYQLGTNGSVITPAAWDSDTTLTSASTRTIKTLSSGASVDFGTWGNLSTAQQACLNKASTCPNVSYAANGAGDGLGSSRLSWLTGQAVTGMRTRTNILGDVINSDPVFVYRQNYGYHLVEYNLETLATGDAIKLAYSDYLDSTTDTLSKSRAAHIPLIILGANDGMMHAFRADTGNADSGKEKFAYVPNALFPNLAVLTDPAYSHQYFVDGTAGIGDAYVNTGDGLGLRWRTILVSGIGAGGKAVFALDITDSTAPPKVLWEKDSTSTGWGELGTMVNTPVITRMLIGSGNTPTWVAVFGNGYSSASGKAILMIVNLVTGAVLETIDTGVTGDNGMGAPAIYNANFNAYIGDIAGDAIYAPDLKGNIWKFNKSGTGGIWASVFTSGSTSLPLFQATDGTNPQPVTALLEIGAAPSGQAGVMIQFGTGKYFETGDAGTATQQSLFGIWDNGTTRITTTDRSDLQAQTLTQVAASGINYRVASSNAVSYPSKRGWYIDLPTSGERVVSAPLLRHGRVIFTTLIPSPDPCLFGGSSWLVEVNATTGANLNYSVFDIDNNNLFNSADYVNPGSGAVPVSGVQYTTGIIKTPAVISAGEVEYKITSSTSSQISVKTEKGIAGHPRSSWREIR